MKLIADFLRGNGAEFDCLGVSPDDFHPAVLIDTISARISTHVDNPILVQETLIARYGRLQWRKMDRRQKLDCRYSTVQYIPGLLWDEDCGECGPQQISGPCASKGRPKKSLHPKPHTTLRRVL